MGGMSIAGGYNRTTQWSNERLGRLGFRFVNQPEESASETQTLGFFQTNRAKFEEQKLGEMHLSGPKTEVPSCLARRPDN